MSLDLSRLENVREHGQKIIARCPACAEQGHDEKGEHLVIMPDGRFGCVTCPGVAGKSHRQRVFALAGDPTTRKRGAFMVRVRRPASKRLPEVAGTVVDLSQLGTGGTPFFHLRATREARDGGISHISNANTQRNGEKASHPSQAPNLPACDPLHARALAHCPRTEDTPPPPPAEVIQELPPTTPPHRATTPATPNIDPETGYPIINGAICPF